MQSYLTMLVLVCAVTAIASAVTAEGKTKKCVQFLLSVIILSVLISPLASLDIQGLSFEKQQNPLFGDAKTGADVILHIAEEALMEEMCRTMELDPQEVRVHINGTINESGEVTLTKVSATLLGDSTAKREMVRKYIRDSVKSDCEVHVYVEPNG